MTTHVRFVGSLVVALASVMLTADVSQAQSRRGANDETPTREAGQQRSRQGRQSAQVWEFLAEKYDKNMDGELTEDEYDRGADTLARLDRNNDGVLTKDDWDNSDGQRQRGGGGRPGGRGGEAPQVGDLAPDFELPYVEETTETVRLSSFAGEKPVALIFGSYT